MMHNGRIPITYPMGTEEKAMQQVQGTKSSGRDLWAVRTRDRFLRKRFLPPSR